MRKAHVHADQVEMGGFVSGRDIATLREVAEAFDVSDSTAQRHLDGLVAQGLLEVLPADRRTGRKRTYLVPGARLDD